MLWKRQYRNISLSQIELRTQANYTYILGKPDLNLCRAYMPFQCTHYKTGEVYKFDSDEERERWDEQKENGESVWLLEDEETSWTPVDVHSATTHNTLIALNYTCHETYKHYTNENHPDIDEKGFKWWRSKGKMFNFIK